MSYRASLALSAPKPMWLQLTVSLWHQSAIRRQDEKSLLTLHCLTTSHGFDYARASVVKNDSKKRTLEIIEAWNTTSTRVNQCTTKDPCYKALRKYVTPCPSWRFQHNQLNVSLIFIITLTLRPTALYMIPLHLSLCTRNFQPTSPGDAPQDRIDNLWKLIIFPTQPVFLG